MIHLVAMLRPNYLLYGLKNNIIFYSKYFNLNEIFVVFPICLMKYIEKDVHEKIVEIRFDDYNAILSAAFDKKDICDYTSISQSN